MEIKIKRWKGPNYSIGKLTVDNIPFCDSLEDTDRGLTSSMTKELIDTIKIKGETAIPTGRYKIDMNTVSPRFGTHKQYQFCEGKLPRLVDVPGFLGVLIHIGNYAKDTDGCILVGKNTIKGAVMQSTETFKLLYSKLKEASDRKEEIWITIE